MPQPPDDQWLKRQNEELQRQLKDALNKLDTMTSRPDLRRTTLPADPRADTSIFEPVHATGLIKGKFVYRLLLILGFAINGMFLFSFCTRQKFVLDLRLHRPWMVNP